MSADPGRPLDALLAGYAAGTLGRPLGILVELHLEIRPENRAFVAALEGVAARALEEAEPRPLSRRDERLAAIFGGAVTAAPVAVPDPVLPAPLRRYIGSSLDQLRWRWLLPGLKEYRFEADGVNLLWARAGARMPNHTHDGSEVTLVLSGAFSDASGTFRRGDIEISDEEVDHRPVVEPGEDCICFNVLDAPLRLTGPIGRWVERIRSK